MLEYLRPAAKITYKNVLWIHFVPSICFSGPCWKLVLLRINNTVMFTSYKMTIIACTINVTLTKLDVLFVRKHISYGVVLCHRVNQNIFYLEYLVLKFGSHWSILSIDDFKSWRGQYLDSIYEENVILLPMLKPTSEFSMEKPAQIKSPNLIAFVNIEIL